MTDPSTAVPSKIGWSGVLNKSVHTSDDEDIGDVYAFSRDFVVVKRGLINKIHYYYIPIKKVEGWDGNVLWLKATEEQVKGDYERNRKPDPLRYHLKDYPVYSGATYPELEIIPPKHETVMYTNTPDTGGEDPIVFACDLCDSRFRSQDELSSHVAANH